MRTGRAMVLLSVSALIGALPYLRAGAVTCCDPWGVPGATAFVAAGTVVVDAIGEGVTAVSNVITSQIQQDWAAGMGKTLEQLTQQTATRRTFEQGRIAAMADLSLNETRGNAAENAIEPALLDETVTNAVLMSEQLQQDRNNRRKEDLALAADLRSADIAPKDPAVRHVLYCDPRAHAAGLCADLPASSLQNADLMVGTITNPGDGQYETMSDDEVAAGRAFIRNVVAPMPLRSRQDNSAQAQQQQHEALLLADQALLSLAGHSLNSVMGHRMRKRTHDAGSTP